MVLKLILEFKYNLRFDFNSNTLSDMIFDKNYFKPNNNIRYLVYHEDNANAGFSDPYNDNPYMLSSLQKLKNNITCKKKKRAIKECLGNYKDNIVENPQINNAFETEDSYPSKTSFAEYAKSSYQKVLKDLENIQKLIDNLECNEPNIIRIIS